MSIHDLNDIKSEELLDRNDRRNNNLTNENSTMTPVVTNNQRNSIK